ncbi:MAG: hypothetical protein ABFD51_11675 [Anaerolineaceae bacterium]
MPPAFITRKTNDLGLAITGIPDLLYGLCWYQHSPCGSSLPVSGRRSGVLHLAYRLSPTGDSLNSQMDTYLRASR